MGGEWGVGASLAMEKVSPQFRGLISGVLQEGYALGNLLPRFFFFFPILGWPRCFSSEAARAARDLRPNGERVGGVGDGKGGLA